jgi:hypothetical protein
MPYTPASWGYSDAEWEQLLAATEDVLTELVPATFGDLPPYSRVNNEIASRTGLSRFDLESDHGRNGIGWLLGDLNDRSWDEAGSYGRELNMPGCLVSSVVVHKNDLNSPIGAAYYSYARRRRLDPGRNREERQDFLLRQQCAAARFWVDRRRASRDRR